MNNREFFHGIMRFDCPGRTLATVGGIWTSTFDRWIAEGMPPEWRDYSLLMANLGLQPHVWKRPDAQLFVYPPFERRTVAQTETTVTYVNELGITCTDFKKDAYKSMPHFESFPVSSRADWQEYRKRLAWYPARVGEPWRRQSEALRSCPDPVILALGRGAGLYGPLREMMGLEALSYAFYDAPDMIADMMDRLVDLFLHACDALFDTYVPDAVCLWEDMAYRNGSLLSVAHVRELMVPRYRVMTAKLREKGVPFVFLDSDGDIGELIPLWLESGIDGVVPMEAQSGMDVALYREKYPRLLMMGGVDKRALARGKAAIDGEIEKIRRTIATGGLIPWFDHGLPHDASWENFLYYVDQLKRVSG